ncbi:MAG: alpha/beta hydrolase [Actinomycetota bacterium]|nr:alpha/beta hydrolase [Actinomycetota bacterium]
MTDTAPDWFTSAIESAPETKFVEVEGTAIRYLSWGTEGKPGLVFVHGGAAHAEWWSFIAPFFSTNWHAVALDLSGHGESGWRDAYGHPMWAQEVMAVATDANFPGPPVVVGHSLGGMVTIQTAATYGDELAGAVIVDTPVQRPSPEEDEGSSGRAFRSPGVYDTLERAMTHFRLIPPQPNDNKFIIDHIARHSLHETEAGWTWKFDPRLFKGNVIPLRNQLASAACRIALLTGEHSSIVPPGVAKYMYDLMGRVSPVVEIPEAHHHLMLDQPLAFVSALRTLLADWNHSTRFRRTDPSVVH